MEKVPSGLSSLKSNVDKIDVDKLVSVPKNLSKLSDVVKNEVVKKTDYNTKIKDIEHKIPYIINSTTTAALNAKIDDIKSKKYLILLTYLQLLLLMLKLMRLKEKYLTIVNISLLQNLIC